MALPADLVRRLAVRAVSMQTFDPSSAILRSIVSAGEFSFISDPSLRAKLAEWEDGLIELKREQDLASEWHNTMLIPRIMSSPSSSPITPRPMTATFSGSSSSSKTEFESMKNSEYSSQP